MQKEFISLRQGIYLLILFFLGSSLVIGGNTSAEQDSWIAILLAMVISYPVLFIYARITSLYPQKDFYDILVELFGKITAKIIISLFSFYAIHLGALVMRNFTDFLNVAAMPETPMIPMLMLMFFITAYLVKSGIEVLGRWSCIIGYFIFFIMVLTIILAANAFNFNNLMPVFVSNYQKIPAAAFDTFGFPFGECVLFLMLSYSLKKGTSPYKLYFYGLLFGGLILTISNIRNFAILGAPMVASYYYPSYVAVRIINVGDFLTRIEGSIAINFILTGITKISVCMLAATQGLSKLFDLQNNKQLTAPVGLLITALCYVVYNSMMETLMFNEIYAHYAFPFQVILPFIIWVTAEIKTRMKKKKQFIG